MLTSAKISAGAKRYIFWNYIYVYLHTKFQVSSIILMILTILGRGLNLHHKLLPTKNEPLKKTIQIRIKQE